MILRERISAALHAEMAKKPGSRPSNQQLHAIARRQMERAIADGLIPADADFDPAADFLDGLQNPSFDGAIFDPAAGRWNRRRGSHRSNLYLPSRRWMYLPSRDNQSLRGRRAKALREGTAADRKGNVASENLPQPNNNGGLGGLTPSQLDQQLRRLSK